MGFASGLTGIVVEDEGTEQGSVTRLNFVGANVTVTVAGNEATVTITGGAGTLTSTELFLDFGTREVAFSYP